MNLFVKKISLIKLLDVDTLSTRSTARVVEAEIIQSNKKKVDLDFKDITFASRSFMDELNIIIKNHPQKMIRKLNMNAQIQTMNELVLGNSTKSISKKEKNSKPVDFMTI